MTLIFCVNFDIKLHEKQDTGQKNGVWISEGFLGPKVPPNLGVGRNFYGSGHVFENFELPDF